MPYQEQRRGSALEPRDSGPETVTGVPKVAARHLPVPLEGSRGPPDPFSSAFTKAFWKGMQRGNLPLDRLRSDVANVSKLLKHSYSEVDAGQFPFSPRTEREEIDVDSHKPDLG